MAKKWNKQSLPKRIASAAIWLIVLPAVAVVQLVRGSAAPKVKK